MCFQFIMVLPVVRLFSLLNKKTMEKVSVLIPVYGVEKFIKKCACSLFEQTYENLEYIFVDDCTKDRSIEIVNEVLKCYSERKAQVRVIHHPVNKGLAAARNTALDHATGEYLMHVDSDDFLERNAVELMYFKAKETSSDVVVCDSYSVYNHGKKWNHVSIPSDKQEYIKGLLYKSLPPSIWGKLFRSRFYKGSGVRSVEGLNQGEDYATVPRLIYYANKIAKVDVPLYNYVQYNAAAYTRNITEKSIRDMVRADEVLSAFFHDIAGEKYEKELRIAMLRTKLALFKMGDRKMYRHISSLYPRLEREAGACLSLTDRLLLKMARYKCYRLMRGCIRMFFWLKRGFNVL